MTSLIVVLHIRHFVCFAVRFNLISDEIQKCFSGNILFTVSALVYIGNVYRQMTVAASKPLYSVTRRNLLFCLLDDGTITEKVWPHTITAHRITALFSIKQKTWEKTYGVRFNYVWRRTPVDRIFSYRIHTEIIQ